MINGALRLTNRLYRLRVKLRITILRLINMTIARLINGKAIYMHQRDVWLKRNGWLTISSLYSIHGCMLSVLCDVLVVVHGCTLSILSNVLVANCLQ